MIIKVKKTVVLAAVMAAASCQQIMANEADGLKVVGKVNVSVDNASEKGPGAKEGTSFKSNASRLGVLGSMKTDLEDTSLIYKAVLQYEAVGENDQDVLFRDAFIGLKSKTVGTVRLGRLTTGYKSSYTKIDPWTDHVLQARQSGQQGASNLNSNYFNNAIDYTSPKWNGFQFNAFVSMLEDASSSRLHNSGKLVAFTGGDANGVGVKYTTKNLRLTADVLDINADSTGSLTNGSASKVGVQYKLSNGLTLAGHYEDVTDLMLGTNYWVHASYKVGKSGLVTASYGINEGDPSDNVYTSTTKGDADTFSIGGKYKLNKRADLIAGYNSHERDGGDDADTITVGIDMKFGY